MNENCIKTYPFQSIQEMPDQDQKCQVVISVTMETHMKRARDLNSISSMKRIKSTLMTITSTWGIGGEMNA